MYVFGISFDGFSISIIIFRASFGLILNFNCLNEYHDRSDRNEKMYRNGASTKS